MFSGLISAFISSTLTAELPVFVFISPIFFVIFPLSTHRSSQVPNFPRVASCAYIPESFNLLNFTTQSYVLPLCNLHQNVGII